MNKEIVIANAISKFHEECSKIPEMDLIEKLHIHEELLIKTILEAVLDNNSK